MTVAADFENQPPHASGWYFGEAQQSIRCDNGPELTSRHFLAWAIDWKIDIVHIQPGKPTQNGGMESFNGKLRDECLNTSWFWTCSMRGEISTWKAEYNSRRPHSSLGYRTPDEFARQWQAASLSEAKDMARISRIKATLTGSASLRP